VLETIESWSATLRETDVATAHNGALCQACGACCAHSRDWPRFTLEDDADIDRIPSALIDDGQARMRCEGDRCAALSGEIGTASACTIYAVRPLVCRDCVPGDDACSIARSARGMPPVAPSAVA
jgi:Fe-S-cluster containining protein